MTVEVTNGPGGAARSAGGYPSGPMKRFALLAVLILVLIPASSALAQTPDEVAATVADTGMYVAPGLDANVSSVSASVTRARNAGVRMMVVLLDDDPTGGAATFAAAV